jgi:hypothetical protein
MKHFVIKIIHLIRFNDIPIIYNSGEITFLIFRVEQNTFSKYFKFCLNIFSEFVIRTGKKG